MNIEQINASGILIAGPARCGKSILAAAMATKDDDLAVMTVEALFPAFRSAPAPQTSEAQKDFVRTYLMRPRHMDPAKNLMRCPADDMGGDIEPIVEGVNASPGTSAIGLIGSSLGQWAKSIDKRAWIAPDLHAELYFERFKKDIPDLGMIVLLRDPRAAIAASLYWRTFPERAPASRRMVVEKLLHWCLSAEAGNQLAQRKESSVSTIFLEDLQTSSSVLRGALPSETLYFSYDEPRGWLAPDGQWLKLLDNRELRMIEHVSQRWFSTPSSGSGGDLQTAFISMGVSAMLAISLLLERLSPGLGKAFVDGTLHPVAISKKKFRNLLSTIWHSYVRKSQA